MLQPKRTKFRKVHKGRNRGLDVYKRQPSLCSALAMADSSTFLTSTAAFLLV